MKPTPFGHSPRPGLNPPFCPESGPPVDFMTWRLFEQVNPSPLDSLRTSVQLFWMSPPRALDLVCGGPIHSLRCLIPPNPLRSVPLPVRDQHGTRLTLFIEAQWLHSG